ncbi:MAG: metallophosphoesterase [bacterium]|nr:metallophosphoesterase [bacterium]
MFGTILLSFVTFFHLYVFWRIYSIPFLKRSIPIKTFILTGILCWSLFFSGRILGDGKTGIFGKIIELAGMDWMASLFLIFICLLFVDIITLYGYLFSKYTPSLRTLALLTGITLSAIAIVQGVREPVIKKYDVYLPGLPSEMEGKVIIAVSDTHIGSILDKNWLEGRVTQVQTQKPDIILLLGDMIEGHGTSPQDLIPILKRLSAPLGVWTVNGNHESHGRENTNRSIYNEAGFNILKNSWAELYPGFILAGIEDLTSNGRNGIKKDIIAETLANKPSGATILLSHSPLDIENAAKNGVNLMLSGHTHGGQIWPFNYLVKLRYPYIQGAFRVNGMDLIVSRGTGTWGPRMRLWQPGEILKITLHRKD